MIEEYLINHCSPILASIKTANLINVSFESFDDLLLSVNRMNEILSSKGIELLILKRCEKSALVYVVRLTLLQRESVNFYPNTVTPALMPPIAFHGLKCGLTAVTVFLMR